MSRAQVKIVNFLMRISFKPAVRFSGSIRTLRNIAKAIDFSFRFVRIKNRVEEISFTNYKSRWVTPAGGRQKDAPVFLYLPGGAFMLRLPRAHTVMVDRLVSCAGASALLTFYRIAPEHQFPAGLDDAVAAYRYLLDQNIAPWRIIVIGDSAGGGLALSTISRIRNESLPMPAGLVTMSPLADMTHSGRSRISNEKNDPVLSVSRKLDQNELYLGDTPSNDSLASPIFADLSGFPPMLAFVSDNEMLLDDTLRLVENAKKVGIDVRLTVGENLPHAWPIITQLKEAREAITQIADFANTLTSAYVETQIEIGSVK